MTAPTAKSRANDISRLLNARGFGQHLPVPPTSHGSVIIVVIPGGYAHSAADMLARTGYNVQESGSDPKHAGCIRLLVSPVRRRVHTPPTVRVPQPARRAPIDMSRYERRPVTEQPGKWVEITSADEKSVNMFTWQKCHFRVTSGTDPDTGRVVTVFPTGYREGMEHFMRMHGYEGEIVPGYRPEVSRVIWSRRYVTDSKPN